MDISAQPALSSFLALPREIRDQILGEVFFSSERQPNIFEQNKYGNPQIAKRLIFPYKHHYGEGCIYPYFKRRDGKGFIDVAIIRTCKQVQHEAETILYATSSWNLTNQDYDPGNPYSYEFFEMLPKRLRRLIKRVEQRCYCENTAEDLPLFNWKVFVTFLARECPNLQSLILWSPLDPVETESWAESCHKGDEWVQAILQIKSLDHFAIGSSLALSSDEPDLKDSMLPWLKQTLTQPSQHQAKNENENEHDLLSKPNDQPFPFLRLNHKLRNQVYQDLLLPPSRKLHPFIKPWYDQTTQNVIPFFLTCRQIHLEAQTMLYSKAEFACPDEKYRSSLKKFLMRRSDVELNGKRTSLERGHVRFRKSIERRG